MAIMPSEQLIFEMRRLDSDPEACLKLANEYVRQLPSDSFSYFNRQSVYRDLGRLPEALADINAAIAAKPDAVSFHERGCTYRQMGLYQEALEDFERAQALDPKNFGDDWLFPLFRADCHARLGDEAAALAECAGLPEEHWGPNVFDLPGGNKQESMAELRRRAAAARRSPTG